MTTNMSDELTSSTPLPSAKKESASVTDIHMQMDSGGVYPGLPLRESNAGCSLMFTVGI
jgi:hypothetical protein